MNIFVINYETDKSTYKLTVLAESREDAIGYLTWKQGQEPGFRINSTEQREEIHAITPKLLDRIRPVDREIVQVRSLVCPWCDSTDYATPHALKIHICKAHAESKDNKANRVESKRGSKK